MTQVYWGDWVEQELICGAVGGKEALEVEFGMEGCLGDVKILYANHDQENWGSGRALVVCRIDGQMHLVYGSHDSCDNMEGQWEPEAISEQFLRQQLERDGFLVYQGGGVYGEWDGLREFIDSL